jgi:hypothetical protein
MDGFARATSVLKLNLPEIIFSDRIPEFILHLLSFLPPFCLNGKFYTLFTEIFATFA